MQYVCTDLHGFSLEKFETMLERISFCDSDFLWVLGDVIDRGNDGVKILKWLMARKNAQLILGNHEDMLLNCDFLFDEATAESIADLNPIKLNTYLTWMSNSGRPTLEALSATRYKEIRYLLKYISDCPLYKELNVNGKKYVLTHSGLGNFKKEKQLYEYTNNELLWNRPTQDTEYYDDAMVIIGHTPTVYYGEEYKGRAFSTETWIDIDVGAGLGLNPMILRLDDLKEFYFDDNLQLV